MKKNTSKQNKALAATAVVLVAALLLGGTFAWQSISQQAKGERETYINPGGRLHYDLSGWEATPYNGGVVTEDVYVENFGNEPIVARVRLDEFMEIGTGAGLMPDEEGYFDKLVKAIPVLNMGTDSDGNPITHTPTIDDESGWWTHIPSQAAGTSTGVEAADPDLAVATNDPHTYWTWIMGGEDTEGNPTGQTVYMPTFNKNKDSLAPDINGTMDAGGSAVQYSDWVNYKEGDTAIRVRDTEKNPNGTYVVPDGAFWDADDNTVAEGDLNDRTDGKYGNGGVEGQNYTVLVEPAHTAKKTEVGAVCSMYEWNNVLTATDKAAHGWWVYDTDGWAYWSQPIYPDTATGVLLDKVTPTAELGKLTERWYYAINAVGQFITLDDVGRGDLTGFYTVPEGETDTTVSYEPTKDAQALLESIGVDLTAKGTMKVWRSPDGVVPTDPVNFLEGDCTYNVFVDYDPDGGLTGNMTEAELNALVYDSTWTLTREDTGESHAMTIDSTGTATFEDGTWFSVTQDSEADGGAWIELMIGSSDDIPEGTRYRIEAHSKTLDSTATLTLPVRSMNTVLEELEGSAQTLWLDGHEWYVLTISDYVEEYDGTGHRAALLLSKDAWEVHQFCTDNTSSDTTGIWVSGDWANLYRYMLENYSINKIDNNAVPVKQGGSTTNGATLFLLSEADLFGTTNGQPAAPSDYTVLNGTHQPLSAPGGSWAATYEKKTVDASGNSTSEDVPTGWWTRTASTTAGNVRIVGTDGAADGIAATKPAGVRPAFWYDMGIVDDVITVAYNSAELDSYTTPVTATTDGTEFALDYAVADDDSVYEAVSSDESKFTVSTYKNGTIWVVNVKAAEGVTAQDWADITVRCYNNSWEHKLIGERTFVVRGSPYTLALSTGKSFKLNCLGTSEIDFTAAVTCASGYSAASGNWTWTIGETGLMDWKNGDDPETNTGDLTFGGTLVASDEWDAGVHETYITVTFDPGTGEPAVSITATVEVTTSDAP